LLCGTAAVPPTDRCAEEVWRAHSPFAAGGYQFYEVSSAARDSRRSGHSSAYWSGRAYSGLGPAAHSFDGRVRRWNLSAWEAYRRAVVAGLPPVEAEEVLTEEQQELERLYLALRTDAGLPLTARYRPLPPATVPSVDGGGVEL